jgi:hypothetical protein
MPSRGREAAAAAAGKTIRPRDRVAKASMNNGLRPSKTYHPTSRRCERTAWRPLRYHRTTLNVWRGVLQAANGMITGQPLATWKTYLR